MVRPNAAFAGQRYRTGVVSAVSTAGETSTIGGLLDDGEEGGQLEVIEPGDGLRERSRVAGTEQAIDVALIGEVDHRADRIGEQVTVRAHFGPVASGSVENAAHLPCRLVTVPASGADQVEQVLDLGVIGDHLSV